MQRDIEQYTKDYRSESYDFEKQMVIFRRKKVLSFLESYNAKNILEIGCGEDSIANYYTNFESFSIVEPSSVFAAKAQQDLQHNTNVIIMNDFVENHIDTLKQTSFDFIILSSLLHEVRNPQSFLKDVMNLCRPHTILHINVPNAHSFHLLWAYQSGLIHNIGELTQNAKRLQQTTTFTLESLQAMAQNACNSLGSGGGGVTIMDSGSYFIKPFNHAKMLSCMQHGIIDEELLLGLEKMVAYMPELGAEIFVNCKVVR